MADLTIPGVEGIIAGIGFRRMPANFSENNLIGGVRYVALQEGIRGLNPGAVIARQFIPADQSSSWIVAGFGCSVGGRIVGRAASGRRGDIVEWPSSSTKTGSTTWRWYSHAPTTAASGRWREQFSADPTALSGEIGFLNWLDEPQLGAQTITLLSAVSANDRLASEAAASTFEIESRVAQEWDLQRREFEMRRREAFAEVDRITNQARASLYESGDGAEFRRLMEYSRELRDRTQARFDQEAQRGSYNPDITIQAPTFAPIRRPVISWEMTEEQRLRRESARESDGYGPATRPRSWAPAKKPAMELVGELKGRAINLEEEV